MNTAQAQRIAHRALGDASRCHFLCVINQQSAISTHDVTGSIARQQACHGREQRQAGGGTAATAGGGSMWEKLRRRKRRRRPKVERARGPARCNMPR